MDVYFIIPPQPELMRPTSYISLGVAYLAAALEKHHHQVQVHDMNIDGELLPEADIYAVTCVSATLPAVREIISQLDKKTVIVGGVHPSVKPDDFYDLKCHVVAGEAEDILPWIIEWKVKPGVTRAAAIPDIDRLCFPARHLFKNAIDQSGIHGQGIGVAATTIISSRGCPYRCASCTSIPQTKRVRFRSPDNMISEIETIVDRYPVKHFRFVDDIFTLNRDRIISFCEKVVKSKLGITWICITRADRLDKDLLCKMRRAGCVETHIGVESGSKRVLDLMNKRTNPEVLGGAIKLIKEAGIRAKTYLMYGFPGETDEDRQLTIDFVRKNRPDLVTISKFTSLPGSKIWKEGYRTEPWFYQDEDPVYQEFRRKIYDAVEGG